MSGRETVTNVQCNEVSDVFFFGTFKCCAVLSSNIQYTWNMQWTLCSFSVYVVAWKVREQIFM